jgi:clan AA aspartic protease (TIGR02281 family)
MAKLLKRMAFAPLLAWAGQAFAQSGNPGAQGIFVTLVIFVTFVVFGVALVCIVAKPDASGPTRISKRQPSLALKEQDGTFVIPVLINGQITLNFTIDSGASDVSIPADVVSTLIRMGAIQQSDFVGQKTYRLADGSTVPSPTFLIRSLKVGSHLLENVTGTIPSAQADLLLGQSFLRRFNSWSIDNKRQVLLLN